MITSPSAIRDDGSTTPANCLQKPVSRKNRRSFNDTVCCAVSRAAAGEPEATRFTLLGGLAVEFVELVRALDSLFSHFDRFDTHIYLFAGRCEDAVTVQRAPLRVEQYVEYVCGDASSVEPVVIRYWVPPLCIIA